VSSRSGFQPDEAPLTTKDPVHAAQTCSGSGYRTPLTDFNVIAAEDCRAATPSRILKDRVWTCKLDTHEAIAGVLGYEIKLVKKVE